VITQNIVTQNLEIKVIVETDQLKRLILVVNINGSTQFEVSANTDCAYVRVFIAKVRYGLYFTFKISCKLLCNNIKCNYICKKFLLCFLKIYPWELLQKYAKRPYIRLLIAAECIFTHKKLFQKIQSMM
jgi:hypothetical protein